MFREDQRRDDTEHCASERHAHRPGDVPPRAKTAMVVAQIAATLRTRRHQSNRSTNEEVL
jgi:hypothetical protein